MKQASGNTSCVTADTLNANTLHTIQMTTNNCWLYFDGVDDFSSFIFTDYPNLQNANFIQLELFTGNCGTLNTLGTFSFQFGSTLDSINSFLLPFTDVATSYFVHITTTGNTDTLFFNASVTTLDQPQTVTSLMGCNHVVNFDFEDFTYNGTMGLGDITIADGWYSPTPSSPDYHSANPPNPFGTWQGNSSAFNQDAGIGAANLIVFNENQVNHREYIEQELFRPLSPNKFYMVRMAVRQNPTGGHLIDNLGMYFSTGGLAQNTSGWIDVSALSPTSPQLDLQGAFTNLNNYAQLGTVIKNDNAVRTHLTIGNFNDDTQVNQLTFNPTAEIPEIASVYVDIVRVLELPDAGEDKIVCPGTPTVLGWQPDCINLGGMLFSWTPTADLDDPNILHPTFTGTTTTTYTVQITRINDVYFDTVTVYVPNISLPDFVVGCSDTVSIPVSFDSALNGLIDVHLIESTGISFSNESFNTSTNTFEIIDPSVLNANGISTLEFGVTIAGSSNTCVFTVNVLSCCGKPDPDDVFAVNTTFTDLFGTSTSLIANTTILVYGTLEVNTPVNFDNCTFKFSPDSRLVVAPNVQGLEFLNSSFENLCPERWHGIVAAGNTIQFTVSKNAFTGATWALDLSNDVDVQIFENVFDNNICALHFSDYQLNQSGPYNNNGYFTEVYENQFLHTELLSFIPFHSATTIDLGVAAGWSSNIDFYAIDVVIENGAGVVCIGNQAYNQNIFEDEAFNTFENGHIHVNNAAAAIENNYFEAPLSTAFNVLAITAVNFSNVRIGGDAVGQGNDFISNGYACLATESAIHFENNYCLISAFYLESPVNFSLESAFHSGSGVQVMGSVIDNNVFDKGGSVTLKGDGTDAYVAFRGNYLHNCPVVMDNLGGQLAMPQDFYTVVNGNTTEHNKDAFIAFTFNDLGHAQIGKNTIVNTRIAFPYTGYGFWSSNCTDCIFSENILQNLDVGMQVRYDHSNTQFSCNVFDACMTGFYFFDATLSDQGDGTNGADNKWLNWTGSQLRMDGNGPLANNIDYHFDVSSSDFDPTVNLGLAQIFLGNIFDIDIIQSFGCPPQIPANQYKNTSEKLLTKTQIYPNPTDRKLSIVAPQDFTYSLRDQVGKEIMTGHSDIQTVELELSLPAGMYVLIVESELGIEYFKIIKR
ncbi:MAG: T9SS type A sorting domain-containing protein [Schleiferiaceae bacterium]|nr:T9SS type A sorting domain-containing protein [Schleiferiaceae bacterium]